MKNSVSSLKPLISDAVLIEYLKEENLLAIKKLIEEHPRMVSYKDQKLGLSLLSNAVIYSKVFIVRYLLDKGADPNDADYIGETPLHHAADNLDIEIAEILLKEKAEPNCMTVDGETPLHHAAFKGDKKFISLLLRYGADPNTIDITLGRTPLYCAVQCDHYDCISLLLSYGADPYIENKEGVAPLTVTSNPFIAKIFNDWAQAHKEKTLKPIPEAGLSEEEKNSCTYSLSMSLGSISFTVTNSSFESKESEVAPTFRCVTEDTTASTKRKKHIEDLPLQKFLKSLKLGHYKDMLIMNGFDDLDFMIYQMASPLAITHKVLQTIGMEKHGHRSRLIMKLEQSAGCTRRIDEKNVVDSAWECCRPELNNPIGISNLKDWLKLLKLEDYLYMFENSGYEDIQFMCSQMNSRYPIDDNLLSKIGIEKIGHRMRILGKLMEDSEILHPKSGGKKEKCILL
jgi:Ankyrin repeats (3 copies)/SAM domain (Sterile alpha motif)/Ankyrin repeat